MQGQTPTLNLGTENGTDVAACSWGTFRIFSVLLLTALCAEGRAAEGPVLLPAKLDSYVERFNAADAELYPQAVPNAKAAEFLRENVPWFECPDPEIERTYYFRWWTYRKHLKETPDGFVITEFLPPVGWASKHNTISCAAGHQLYEGRWLRDGTDLGRLHGVLAAQRHRTAPLQSLAGRRDLGSLLRQRQRRVAQGPAARSGAELPSLGAGTPRSERLVLAGGRRRRDGGSHRRHRIPSHDQQLYVRRRAGHCRDRGVGGPGGCGAGIRRRSGADQAAGAGETVGRRRPVLQDAQTARQGRRPGTAAGRRARAVRFHAVVLPSAGRRSSPRLGGNCWTRRASTRRSGRRRPSSGIRSSRWCTAVTSASGTGRAGRTRPP